MRNIVRVGWLVLSIFAFLSFEILAADPPLNPNGFPSGPHYNLNIIGKKDSFTCPATLCDPLDLTCVPNVIYIPADNNLNPDAGPVDPPVEIQVVSGRKGSAKTAGITGFAVTDWCSEAFDGDGAVVQLPPNENGYRVYARALATPTYNPNLQILGNTISFVEDDAGNLLYYLGSFTKDCVKTPDAAECFYTRTKGRSVATDISPLFEFTGAVCYFDPTGYCGGCRFHLKGRDDRVPLKPQDVDQFNGPRRGFVELGWEFVENPREGPQHFASERLGAVIPCDPDV